MDDFTRGIKGSCAFSGGGLGFGIVACQKVFKHFSQEFGVEGYFFFDGGVFGDGKFVSIEDGDQASGGVFVFFGVIDGVEIHFHFGAKEEKIGHFGSFAWIARKAIGVLHFKALVFFVEAVEESSVEEGGGLEQLQHLLFGDGKLIVIAIEGFNAIFFFVDALASILCKFSFAYFLVEGGKKQVLQDGLVKTAIGGVAVKVVQDLFQVPGGEEFFIHQAFFFDKPDEDDAGEEADQAGGVAYFFIFFNIPWKADVFDGPEVPVG